MRVGYQLDKISEENEEQLILKEKDFTKPNDFNGERELAYRSVTADVPPGAEGIDAVAAYLSVSE
ncbi:MAG: hypothetical protein MZV64_37235 [Ignavibacteriales bacterium]|nr:hypothetical protein [Ignavibacteriales bacterium]